MALSTDTSGKHEITDTSEKYDVFLSFRGSDTRHGFTSFLYHDMVDKGIRVFKDEELQVGEKIEGLLRQALKDSQIYIPIFSRGFASSARCLREVADMVDYTSNWDGKEILPIFFDVKPEDVKCSTELYSNALSEHKKKHALDEVERWGNALREVTSRAGWTVAGEEQGKLVKLIVQKVLLKLTEKNRRLPDHLVETEDTKCTEELLAVDSGEHV